MIDIHSHILPEIDDGSNSLSESIEIIKKAYNSGVTDLVLTPHFILGSSYNANNKAKTKLFNSLKKEIKKEKLPINLYLGNEVFIETNILDLIKTGEITTLNNSKYLLFELPMHNEFKQLKQVVFELKLNGYIPVLAHPERYSLFKKNPQIITDLLEQGVLFQCNISSFYGRHGKEAKQLFILMLKHHMIHFISSDTHHIEDTVYDKLNDLKQDLKKYISEEEIKEILEINARKVLENKKIEERELVPFKKTIFGKWK